MGLYTAFAFGKTRGIEVADKTSIVYLTYHHTVNITVPQSTKRLTCSSIIHHDCYACLLYSVIYIVFHISQPSCFLLVCYFI